MKRQERIQSLLEYLATNIYEREEVIRLAFLAAISGESIFLLGPPGVAKSLIARRLKFAFKEGKSFEYLMNKFSTPDEIFGPVSIKKLKDEDKYERLTEKYLPGANIVFLDEIWKASSAIQNALLTVLNEKIYRNGEQELSVDIKAIISASNEVPNQQEGVAALWDRFLVRYFMGEIKQSKNFIQMITSTKDVYENNVPDELKVTNKEYESWSSAIDEIAIPEEVANTIQVIKRKLDEHNHAQNQSENQVLIYDRRWKKTVRLLRASAFLNERKNVDLMDCFLIAHCLWHKPEDFEIVMKIISETIRQHGYSLALNLSIIKKEIKDLETEIKQETQIQHKTFSDEPQSVKKDFFEVLDLRKYFDGQLIKKADFGKLSLDEDNSVSLFDEEQNLTNRVNARLGREVNTIAILYNSKLQNFNIKTKKVEKVELISKKPHPIIAKYWEESLSTLEEYIRTQKSKLTTESPKELDHLRHNLFVHAKLSEIVEANMKESKKTLNTLQLQVEKLAFEFKSL